MGLDILEFATKLRDNIPCWPHKIHLASEHCSSVPALSDSLACSVQIAVCSVQSAVLSVQCGVWSVNCDVCILQCTVNSVNCIEYSIKCFVYKVQCSVLFRVQCTVQENTCEPQGWSRASRRQPVTCPGVIVLGSIVLCTLNTTVNNFNYN